jgi:hypothetical protein
MQKNRLASVLGLLTAIVLCVQSQAQSPRHTTFAGKTVFTQVNEQAVLSRAGNADATLALTHLIFKNTAIPSEAADSFGFTDRIVQAENEYRSGAHAAVHEADIVRAVNNLATEVTAPAWAHTTQAEVHKLRMHLLVPYPDLIANQNGFDSKGRYTPLNENMRPVEAAFIATTLLYQKIYNSDYQFTDAERAQNTKLDAATVNAKHFERQQSLRSLVSGRSNVVSLRDFLTASDHFFSDLGIQSTVGAGPARLLTSVKAIATKGGK